MQGSFSSDAAIALAAARSGSSTITALLDAVVLDPSVDWIAAKRAAAADKRLDSAMALNLWLAHMQELLPARLQRMSEAWHSHGAAALTALQSVREATDLEQDSRTKLEAGQSYDPFCLLMLCLPYREVCVGLCSWAAQLLHLRSSSVDHPILDTCLHIATACCQGNGRWTELAQ